MFPEVAFLKLKSAASDNLPTSVTGRANFWDCLWHFLESWISTGILRNSRRFRGVAPLGVSLRIWIHSQVANPSKLVFVSSLPEK